MGRKKKPDKWVLMMRQCEKDGFGVHYGHWIASKEPVVIVKKDETPKDWPLCEYEPCRQPFKPKTGKRFCCQDCAKRAYYETGKPAQKDVFGEKRLLKIHEELKKVDKHFSEAFVNSQESGYYQEKLDQRLRAIFGEIDSFKVRYPYLKDWDYNKKLKG